MLRIFIISMFCMLVMTSQSAFCADKKQTVQSSTVQQTENYDFSSSANYVSDEQLEKEARDSQLEENTSWLQKVINSSHFSSNTATETYMPLNKIQD